MEALAMLGGFLLFLLFGTPVLIGILKWWASW
jgi:hypothetical protein